jgi:5-formyltetrahydrofolate cyclo-ligase
MTFSSKSEAREYCWRLLEERGAADSPKPVRGRIPNFIGSGEAAQRLLQVKEFRRAGCVFSAPDRTLYEARKLALREGKILALALPNMKGFVEISRPRDIAAACVIRGFRRYGRPLRTPADFFLQGAVAVDLNGNRLGKGKGYGDKEWHYLLRRNLLRPAAPVVTLVHDLQVLEDMAHLMRPHDVRVDIIVTPTRIIRVEK